MATDLLGPLSLYNKTLKMSSTNMLKIILMNLFKITSRCGRK